MLTWISFLSFLLRRILRREVEPQLQKLRIRSVGHGLQTGDRIRTSTAAIVDPLHRHANPAWSETPIVVVNDEDHFEVLVMVWPSESIAFSWRRLDCPVCPSRRLYEERT
jgi:hypothetical protein